uniref:Putative proteasome maturation factor ump1 n=1 Tax=Ixodes ricinus TaxID=34613 RepID=A0A131XT79_IXORI
MDFPPLRPTTSQSKPTTQENGAYGINDVMLNGFSSVKNNASTVHPLELSERNYKDNNLKIQLAMARSIQGLHGPIKLMAERKAASQVGRLPFLPSSNVMLDALEGGDETITFEDIYNEALEGETLRPPHMVMEKHLNML